MKKYTNDQLAFFVARIAIGVNLLVHGLVRIPKLIAFAEGLTKGFSETLLPTFIVAPFAYVLPFIELILGLFLIVGFKTRVAVVTSTFLITLLIFGSGLKEDWAAVGTQMIYVIFFFLLLKNLDHNCIAIDSKRKMTVDGFKTKK